MPVIRTRTVLRRPVDVGRRTSIVSPSSTNLSLPRQKWQFGIAVGADPAGRYEAGRYEAGRQGPAHSAAAGGAGAASASTGTVASRTFRRTFIPEQGRVAIETRKGGNRCARGPGVSSGDLVKVSVIVPVYN